ncbi:hypothetical protein PISL3812_01258 [Talaromyces islandicus]|uniref:Fe2OG dioxygenase domain-containing protein n=1 Tax=Talaromyces islandicus TaxID=28573 RepID=A0A0U1LM72_TALIS|nr:hypothetical protein PISL3812_01258 [Talaromyces islandicus]
MSQIDRLSELICTQQSKTSFTCGGSIAVRTDKNDPDVSWVANPTEPIHSRPINIFWASKDKAEVNNVTLPIDGDGESDEKSKLRKLVGDCSPASFGRGLTDVLDETYRRAGKMNLEDFASSFQPADFGLIQHIEQTLLPSVLSNKENSFQAKGLIAELYKLNVYSGPSGHFKAHVDTPRSGSQIGSLVVSLPSKFSGGSLIVRHGAEQVDFDWAATSGSHVQWAAFYSDCEHEITKVTDGHRITLTYNLHAVDLVGGVLLANPVIDPKTLPLYGLIESLMRSTEIAKGKRIGIYCSHAYAHTSNIAKKRLPHHLKGSDLILYAISKHLGYSVSVLPVLDYDRGFDVVGTRLHPHRNIVNELDDEEEDRYLNEIEPYWDHRRVSNIIWLNNHHHGEGALSYATYGNQPSLGWVYSHAVIIVSDEGDGVTEVSETDSEEGIGSENDIGSRRDIGFRRKISSDEDTDSE